MQSLVFEPLKIRGVELRNRIVWGAHGTLLSTPSHRFGGEDILAYHEARAKGGAGLIVIEATSVHASSGPVVRSDDEVVGRYRELVDRIRPYGTRVFQQFIHMADLIPHPGGGLAWSPSGIPSLSGVTGQPMSTGQIAELVEAFGAAGARCRDGGLDGVELHAAHGALPFQFLSPLYNQRTDEYGGSLENRTRLLSEILRALRWSAADDFVVGVRLGASEVPGSVNEHDLRAVIAELEREGLIDYLMTSYGDFYRPVLLTAGMEMPAGYQLASSGQLTSATTVPRGVAGRFRTLDEVERVLADGTADFVWMVRALIADPDLPRKTREGRVDEVRPCIACNQGCLAGLGGMPPRIGCTVSPTAGHERLFSEEKLRPVDHPQRVTVVGGGPAGLEAARVAALRGHQVRLVEASGSLGGALVAARRAPRYGLLGDIVDWYSRALERGGVEVTFDSRVSAADLQNDDADVVIVATGSTPRLDGFQPSHPFQVPVGVGLPHVLSSTQLLTAGPPKRARTALVLDTVGHFEAIGVAEALVERDLAVTFVTSLPSLGGPIVYSTWRDANAMEFLHRGDFTLLIRHHLTDIGPATCKVQPIYGSGEREIAADVVVLVTPNRPNRELHDDLVIAGRSGVFLVGDAAAARDLTAAIAEGHRAAREIGCSPIAG